MTEQTPPKVVQPIGAAEASLRRYTEAEIRQFLADDKIDAETAAAVRRLLAADAFSPRYWRPASSFSKFS